MCSFDQNAGKPMMQYGNISVHAALKTDAALVRRDFRDASFLLGASHEVSNWNAICLIKDSSV
jgi:hypothetical protein